MGNVNLFFPIFEIFSFLFVTALQISILSLIVKRKGAHDETIFAFFTFTTLVWNFGVFISQISTYLYTQLNIVERIFNAISLTGFTLMHPLAVHTLINFIETRYLKLKTYLRYTILLSIYLPTVYFFVWPLLKTIPYFSQNAFELRENFLAQFSIWSAILLVISWLIVVKLCRSLEEEEERNFLSLLDWLVTSVLAIYIVTFILNVRFVPHIGDYLSLASNVFVSLLPTLFGYYLYRYSYIEYVFKRGLIYMMLGFTIIVLYISVVVPLGKGMEEHFQINFRMLQGILVMVMVFFFDTLKKKLQVLFNRVVFRENQYFQNIFIDLSKTISQVHMDIDNLLDYSAFSISRAMKIREVSIVLFEEKDDSLQIQGSTLSIMPPDINEIIHYIKANRPKILSRYHLHEENIEVLRQMKGIKAFNIIPIYNENIPMGILNIGKKPVRNHFLAEEEEMFIILVNQLSTTIENTKLAREKFALERKMYEFDKLTSLGRLSASIAHEVKNPLSSIKAITQVMREEMPIEDANQEGLSIIIQEIDRLSRVVNQLLHFARPKSHTRQTVNIDKIISDVVMLIKHNANRNNVEINVDIGNVNLYTDQDALMEVFINLTNNAIQSMSNGGKLTITSSVKEAQKEFVSYCIINITDNGPGIPAQEKDKIFEPFYTTKQSGTGLGLAIVKRQLEKIKGSIVFEDNKPGAKFIVSIPIIDEIETV